MNKLYFLGNQMGNIKDLPPRSKEKLEKAALVIFETDYFFDNLVKDADIKVSGETVKFSESDDLKQRVVEKLEVGDVALIADFGYPIVADIGSSLSSYVIEKGFEISVIPGPSIATTAQVLAALQPFRPDFLWQELYSYHGEDKFQKLSRIANVDCNIVLVDHPSRMEKTLSMIQNIFEARPAALIYNASMNSEKVVRTTCNNLLEQHREVLGVIAPEEGFVKEVFVTVVIGPPSFL